MTLRSSFRALVVGCLVGTTLLGCRPDEGPPLGGRLDDTVAAGSATASTTGAGVELPGEPRSEMVLVDGEGRPAVVLPAGVIGFSGVVAEGARLTVGAQLAPGTVPSPLTVSVTVVRKERRTSVAEATLPVGSTDWVDLDVDLDRFAGRFVRLEVEGRTENGVEVAWAPVAIVAPGERPERPNVVIVLVDTWRADRLSFYGAERETTPNVERELVDRGVVIDRAYAQAPWTLPSVISLLSGRRPADVLGREQAAFGLPRDTPSLASVFRDLGYRTAGFVGNATLHRGNGASQGFDTFFSPTSLEESMLEKHGDDIADRSIRWLAGHVDQPFFLYAHFIDPHDPYESPLTRDGRSRYEPDYEGPITGRHVHGIYLGKHVLPDPERDIAHLEALYDEESLYVDQQIARVLDAIPPSVAENTIFVVTSDHGEEFFEHGGWKHGRTLYEEQLWVPLVLRWDDRFPAGSRLEGPVELVDLARTLVTAAGGAVPTSWAGRDLMPRLTDPSVAPPRPQPRFVEHYSAGQPRGAVTLGRWKLILFDEGTVIETENQHQQILADTEAARLSRIELYDLEADPGETKNVAADHPDLVRRLSVVIHHRLGNRLAGLRVVGAGLEPGQIVSGSVRFDRAPTGWTSYFLGPDDVVRQDGDRLLFTFVGEPLAKGIRLLDEELGIVEIESAPPGVEVLVAGSEAGPGPWAADRLRTPGFPGTGDGPAILIWDPETGDLGDETVDEETQRRLEALGYAG